MLDEPSRPPRPNGGGGLRLLVLTRIFPSGRSPLYAPYLLQQCQALARRCSVQVVAPVPWVPAPAGLLRKLQVPQASEGVPTREELGGLTVHHPRAVHVPGATSVIGASALALSLTPHAASWRSRFDAILATWAYPDGVAAIALGAALGVPVHVQTIGSDLNVVAQSRGASWQLRQALPRARSVIAVSRPLAKRACELGAPPRRVHVVPTGVDRGLFYPRPRAEARAAVGLAQDAELILFVGRLESAKGLSELMAAFERLATTRPGVQLALVGGGSEQARCAHWAAAHPQRVRLLGELPLEGVALWLGACDLLTLPSHREGTPNVILEALSAGRPVVATNVGGIPDVITTPAFGRLVPPRDAPALAAAWEQVLIAPPPPGPITQSPALLDWAGNADLIMKILEDKPNLEAPPVVASNRGATSVSGTETLP